MSPDLGFTHIELLPITEHPLDASWGYQPIGLFAPTAASATPTASPRFVDRAHRAGLGVILDWVPAHFPTDEHGLAHFDGTALYEHADPRRGFHPDWNTAIYNFGRREVANVPRRQRALLAGALPRRRPARRCGRLDALPRLFAQGGRVAAQRGRRHARTSRRSPSCSASTSRSTATIPASMTIAEESTAWPGVSQPVHAGRPGLRLQMEHGLDARHAGLHDARSRSTARCHHNELTFGLLYAFSENFVLPLSHDEVVHGKGSLLGKMPGDDWQKFADTARLLRLHVGLSRQEAAVHGAGVRPAARMELRGAGLDWDLLDRPLARGVCRRWCAISTASIASIPRCMPATASRKASAGSSPMTREQSVFAWLRFGAGRAARSPSSRNFTPVPRARLPIGLPHAGRWREILNTDATIYGGSGVGNLGAVNAAA